MIEYLFIRILNMSLTGSFVILAVLLLRLFLKRVPRIFSYCLWAVVLFRLVCPVSFSAAFSPLGTLKSPSVEHGRMEYISADVLYDVSSGGEDTVYDFHQNEVSGKEKPDTVKPVRNMVQTGAVIWVLGICIMGIYSVVTLIQLKNKLKTAWWEKENIYITESIGTPFVIGILKPRIYLPSVIGSGEREYVVLHEKIHIKRGDHILKIAAFVVLCIHWFNPFVWVAFFLSGEDMEMSCDEAVIRKIGSHVKKEYTTSLLSMAIGSRIINGIPLAFGEGDTTSRIKNVLRYKKPATFAVAAAIIVCITAAVILLANPDSAEAGEKADSSQVYYGVVEDVQIGDKVSRLLIIPGIGEVTIPRTKEVYTYFERDEQELLPGDMVQIVFPEGEEVLIQETWPASFSTNAKCIIVMWQGCGLQRTMDAATYRFTFPKGIVPDALAINPGDILSIYWDEKDASYLSHVSERENSMMIIEAPVYSVEETEDGVSVLMVELSLWQIEILFKGFGFHIHFALENMPGSINEKSISNIMWNHLGSAIREEKNDTWVWLLEEIRELEIEGTECFALDLRYTFDETKNGAMAGRLVGSYAVSKDGREFYRYNQADDIWEKMSSGNFLP